MASDGEYDGAPGALLVYKEGVEPSGLEELLDHNCFDATKHQLQYVYEILQLQDDGEWVVDAAEEAHAPPPLAKIEDAARFASSALVGRLTRAQRTPLYSEGHQQTLPRLLEFPASNATGVPNPFARMPAEDWFGDVYS